MTILGVPVAEMIRPPWRRYVVESRLARELVVRALAAKVGPRRWIHFSADGPPFEGSVSPEGFRIKHVIRYRNAFVPLIIGRFEPSAYGTRIAITMRPVIGVLVFWLFWMTAVGVIEAVITVAALSGEPRAFEGIPVAIAMLAAGYLIASGGFGYEAYKVRPLIEEILTNGQGAAPTP